VREILPENRFQRRKLHFCRQAHFWLAVGMAAAKKTNTGVRGKAAVDGIWEYREVRFDILVS